MALQKVSAGSDSRIGNTPTATIVWDAACGVDVTGYDKNLNVVLAAFAETSNAHGNDAFNQTALYYRLDGGTWTLVTGATAVAMAANGALTDNDPVGATAGCQTSTSSEEWTTATGGTFNISAPNGIGEAQFGLDISAVGDGVLIEFSFNDGSVVLDVSITTAAGVTEATINLDSDARVKRLAITDLNLDSDARVKVLEQTINRTSDAKVVVTTEQAMELDSDARVKRLAIFDLNLLSDARVKVLDITPLSLLSDARVKRLDITPLSLLSDAKVVLPLGAISLDSDARVKRLDITPMSLLSDARVKTLENPISLDSDSRVKRLAIFDLNLDSDSRVKRLEQSISLDSDAKVTGASAISLLSDARVKVSDQTLSLLSDAKAVYLAQEISLDSDARVKRLDITPLSLLSDAKVIYLDQSISLLSDARVQTLENPLSLLSDARVNTVENPISLDSDARVKTLEVPLSLLSDSTVKVYDQTLSLLSDAKVTESGALQLNSNARVKVLAQTLSLLSDAFVVLLQEISLNSDARVNKTDNSLSLLSDARVNVVDNSISLDSDSRVKVTDVAISLLSDAKVSPIAGAISLDSDSRVKVLDNTLSLLSDAKVSALLSTISLTSDARVRVTQTINLTSDANVKILQSINLLSDAQVSPLRHIFLYSDAKVSGLTEGTFSLLSDASVKVYNQTLSLVSDARVIVAPKFTIIVDDSKVGQVRNLLVQAGRTATLVRDNDLVPLFYNEGIMTIYTDFQDIIDVSGLWLSSDIFNSGTNYLSGASIYPEEGRITMPTNITGWDETQTEALITYAHIQGLTDQQIQLNINIAESYVQMELWEDSINFSGTATYEVFANHTMCTIAAYYSLMAINSSNAIQSGYNYRLGDFEIQTKLWGEGMIAETLLNKYWERSQKMIDALKYYQAKPSVPVYVIDRKKSRIPYNKDMSVFNTISSSYFETAQLYDSTHQYGIVIRRWG